MIAVTATVYTHVLANDFVNYDDAANVVNNYSIRQLDWHTVRSLFTSVRLGYWIPVAWLSHAVVYRFFGLDPAMHHLFNVVLHLGNTVLIFVLAEWLISLACEFRDPAGAVHRTQVPLIGAALAGVLFGLHPLQVESVAWASERKDVLYSLFFLLSLLAYLVSTTSARRRMLWLVLCWGTFVLSVMSKPMAVTLPIILLLLDYWPMRTLRRGFARLILEKVPFFLVALAVGLVTVRTQASVGALTTNQSIADGLMKAPASALTRAVGQVLNAFYAVIFYLKNAVLPTHLGIYSWRTTRLLSAANVVSLLAFMGISAVCFAYRKRHPELTIGWVSYLITLAPTFGVLPSVADRFTYLSNACLFVLAGAAVAAALSRLGPRLVRSAWAVALSCLLLAAALAPLTFRQIGVWKDSVTLWQHAAALRPSPFVVDEVVRALRRAGRLEEARRQCDSPVWTPCLAHNCRGAVLLSEGGWVAAMTELRHAIALDPKESEPYQNIWIAYDKLGMTDEAIAAANKAIELNPLAENFSHLAISYGRKGQAGESEAAFLKALALDPENPEFLNNLAITYQLEGKLNEAIQLLQQAHQRSPREVLYVINLGNAYLRKNSVREALSEYARAVSLAPSNVDAHLKLAQTYDSIGQADQADTHYRVALDLGGHLDSALRQRLEARKAR